jgi:multidrug/hemolysin transport system permease protein
MSAVGTIVSAGYGFISGAYMPISQFSTGLQKVIFFLPGTYGTSLLREHAMRGCFAEMLAQGVPQEAITEIQKVVDYELHFFGSRVSQGMKYLVLLLAVAIILGIYVAMQARKQKKARSLS